MREQQEYHPWFSKPPRHKVQSPLEPITVRAALAQSVERFTRNEKVVGSIPTGGSDKGRNINEKSLVFRPFA